MRTSQYVIFIHVPERDDYYIVHSFTGAVDKVSPDVVGYLLAERDPARIHRRTRDEVIALESLQGRTLGEISEETRRQLHQRGYLTDKSLAEETKYLETLARFIHQRNRKVSYPSFMLVPMYECNLRCPYCFEKDTRIKLAKMGKSVLQRVVSREQIDDMFHCMDIITKTKHNGNFQDLIRLYGGEPLADMTKDVVEYLVEKGVRLGYNFEAVTNGVDLDQFFHLLGPDKIHSLQITFDGPKHIHDRKRVGPLHKKTYDRIVRNLKAALDAELEVQFNLRVHADKKNIDVLTDLVDDLERQGIKGAPNVRLVSETTADFTAFDEDCNSTFPEPTMRHPDAHQFLENQDPGLLPVLNLSDLRVTETLSRYIKNQLPGIAARLEPCSSTTGQYIFDPNGKIYSCWEDVGIAGREIGAYSSQGPEFNELEEVWVSRSPAEIDDCRKCKYALFHFSGCGAIPMHQKEDPLGRACYDYEESFLYFSHRLFRDHGDNLLKQRAAAAANAK